MPLDTKKLYYMFLPVGKHPYETMMIVPLVESALDKRDFEKLNEFLYIKVTQADGLHVLPITTRPPKNHKDYALFVGPGGSKHTSKLASKLLLYMFANNDLPKLIALNSGSESQEEPTLTAAIRIINERCRQIPSENPRQVVLEKLVEKKK